MTRDKAAEIQAREFITKQKLEKLEENAKKFGGFQVKGRRPTTPWGRLFYWLGERKKKRLAAKLREEQERARYAAARQAEMDRRAVAKAKEKGARRRPDGGAAAEEKEEVAGLKTPGALSEGAGGVHPASGGRARRAAEDWARGCGSQRDGIGSPRRPPPS